MQNWRYYNHAVIPTSPPHVEVDETPITDGSIWKCFSKERPIMARWTQNFDCPAETDFWYVIKDDAFDIASLKAKRRYEINKGKKNFTVKQVNASDYHDELFEVRKAFFIANGIQPEAKEAFLENTKHWDRYLLFLAFEKETDHVCGYIRVENRDSFFDFLNLTVDPQYEKMGVNAALVAGMLEKLNDEIVAGKYICDGSRSIFHQTLFQDYLEKYFGFRKAYCDLKIAYPVHMKMIMGCIRPFRKILAKYDSNGRIHMINSVLKIDELGTGRT